MVAAPPAPEGARVIDVVAACGLVISLLGAASSAIQVAEYLQRWRRSDQERNRIVVDVAIPIHGGVPSGRRKALIIANSTYLDQGLNGLRSPGTDARELAAVLSDPRIYQGPQHLRRLTILRSLRRLHGQPNAGLSEAQIIQYGQTRDRMSTAAGIIVKILGSG